jgi:hypothetical protein
MSLSHYRDSVTAALQKQVDLLAQSAIDMRVHPEMKSDTYAMVQVDKLAQARAYADAARIVIAEYKKLTEVPKDSAQSEGEPKAEKREATYG